MTSPAPDNAGKLRKIDQGLKIWPPIPIHGYDFYITPDPYHRGKIWVENPDREGLQIAEKQIPFKLRDSHTWPNVEALDDWWDKVF